MAWVKRSPKRTANWALAIAPSRGGILHSFSARFSTRNSSFIAASSVGKWPLARTVRRIGHERRPLGLKGLPDGPIPELGMAMGLGVGDCLPGVQLLVALHLHPWGE